MRWFGRASKQANFWNKKTPNLWTNEIIDSQKKPARMTLNYAYYRCWFLVNAQWHFDLPLVLLCSVEVWLWGSLCSLLSLKFGNQALKNLLLHFQPAPTQFTTLLVINTECVLYWDTVGHHHVNWDFLELKACSSLARRLIRCNKAMSKMVSERTHAPAAGLWKCLWMVARFLKLAQQYPLSFHCCRSFLSLYLIAPLFMLFMSSLPSWLVILSYLTCQK